MKKSLVGLSFVVASCITPVVEGEYEGHHVRSRTHDGGNVEMKLTDGSFPYCHISAVGRELDDTIFFSHVDISGCPSESTLPSYSGQEELNAVYNSVGK